MLLYNFNLLFDTEGSFSVVDKLSKEVCEVLSSEFRRFLF